MKNMLKNSRGGALLAGAVGAGVLVHANSAMAEASAYVTQLTTAASQITEDLGAAMPIALGVAVVSVGIFIVWRVFKRLAAG